MNKEQESAKIFSSDSKTFRNHQGISMHTGDITIENITKIEGSAGLEVKVADGKVSIGSAHVIKTDIIASNGVIHVIDTVLMPE